MSGTCCTLQVFGTPGTKFEEFPLPHVFVQCLNPIEVEPNFNCALAKTIT